MPNSVCDPGVALTVDGNGAQGNADLELLSVAGIIGREAGHRVGAAIGDPNPVLLIDGQMEGGLDLERAVLGLAIPDTAFDSPPPNPA